MNLKKMWLKQLLFRWISVRKKIMFSSQYQNYDSKRRGYQVFDTINVGDVLTGTVVELNALVYS